MNMEEFGDSGSQWPCPPPPDGVIAQLAEYFVTATSSVRAPLWLIQKAGRFLGKVLYNALPIRHNVIAYNLQRACPHLSPTDRRRVVRGVYQHYATSFLVLFFQPDNISDLLTADSDRLDAKIQASQTGVIFVTGHIGFWELLPRYLSQLTKSRAVIPYKRQHNYLAEALVSATRRHKSPALYIPVGGSYELLENALQRSAHIGLLGDQRVKRRGNGDDSTAYPCTVPFLNQPDPIPFHSGIGTLHMHTKAPVYFVALIGVEDQLKFICERLRPVSGRGGGEKTPGTQSVVSDQSAFTYEDIDDSDEARSTHSWPDDQSDRPTTHDDEGVTASDVTHHLSSLDDEGFLSPQHVVEAYACRLTELCMDYPEQYYWFHQRFDAL